MKSQCNKWRLTLRDGDGLEAVQLSKQAAPLAGVQAVDEVLGPLRRVQRLHGVLPGVCAQQPAALQDGGPRAPPLPAPGLQGDGRAQGCPT